MRHKKYFNLLIIVLTMIVFRVQGNAQVSPVPSTGQSVSLLLKNATIHWGNGESPAIGDIFIENGKLIKVGNKGRQSGNNPEKILDLTGKHIYPGLIAVNSDLGLEEIEAVRATRDAQETGQINPNARAIIAYNTDSKVIPTVRANGVLLAQIAPKGGVFSGTSSIVQLDAWNYEDAVMLMDDAVYLNWPDTEVSLSTPTQNIEEQKKNIRKAEADLHIFMKNVQAFAQNTNKDFLRPHNLLYESMVPVIKQEKSLFIRAYSEKQILGAIAFGQQYNLRIVLVGAQEAYLQIDLLKKLQIPVVLFKPHQLPFREDDPIDLPFRLPEILENAGIPYCFDMDIFWNERNLPFQAGTAAAYGIPSEKALKALTFYPAKILGIDSRVGTLEPNKDATLIVSEGDLMDMRTSVIFKTYIQGREVSLENLHTDLYEKFRQRYK